LKVGSVRAFVGGPHPNPLPKGEGVREEHPQPNLPVKGEGERKGSKDMDYLKFAVEMFHKGGIFMWPLLVCAIVSVVLIIERALYLRENKIDWDRFHFELKNALKEENLEKAVVLAAKTKGVIGRVMQECLLGIKAGHTNVEEITEKEVLSEMGPMERSRGWLATMIQVAPLLGLIGTVQGMIQCFMQIEAAGTADPKMLAGGIYTALITTFAGLMVAIPSSIAQEHIRKESNNILHRMDLCLMEVQEWVDEREEGKGKLEGRSEKFEVKMKRENGFGVEAKAPVGGPHPNPLPKGEGARAEHPHPSPVPEGEGVREEDVVVLTPLPTGKRAGGQTVGGV
jgi:biopolymer transport protein ExbB